MLAFSRLHGRSAVIAPAALTCAILLLAACKDKPEVVVKPDGSTTVMTSSEGATVESADDGESLELSTALPAFAPAYPGARLRTQLSDGNSDGKNGGKGGLVVFETADPIEKVAAFYDARAKEHGMKAAMVVNEPDSAVRIFSGKSGKDGRAGGALVAISRSKTGDNTDIVITAGMEDAQIKRMETQKDGWRDAARPIRLQ